MATFYKAVGPTMTVFRRSQGGAYAYGGFSQHGALCFASKPKPGLYPVEVISEAEYKQLQARRDARLAANPKRYSGGPQDSWCFNV
jgi:hypothetical protein